MKKKSTLQKKERLKSRATIEELFKNGQRFTLSPFRVHFSVAAPEVLQFGAGVITRNFKKAVDRNRIKRLTREAYRLQKDRLQNGLDKKKTGLNLFLIYTGKELPDYKLVYDKVDVILNKLCKLLDENNTSDS